MTVDQVFTPNQCREFIDFSHQFNYEVAPITTNSKAGIFELRTDIRNNQRVIYDDLQFAERIFQQVKQFLPEALFEWHVSGLNERFRFYLYEDGQTFKPHFDGNYAVNDWYSSQLTLLIYLSGNFEGGETKFFNQTHHVPTSTIQPKTGQILIFEPRQMHSGAPVFSGQKYVLRTDVMYKHAVFNRDNKS
ncbi:2OG-Fe(II) oxygenase [Acinetobacter sp. Marseille-Q1618]|uniref:prolyl hydroxylase family protein n=1 Tax=Acinetobacter sp. Marseille-Q1618 TaxID=2697502 RepID=UPI00156FA3D7|nr:2OG-Fe(II) oxygenase [Acinetobacter sp. Marseille-Q1618]